MWFLRESTVNQASYAIQYRLALNQPTVNKLIELLTKEKGGQCGGAGEGRHFKKCWHFVFQKSIIQFVYYKSPRQIKFKLAHQTVTSVDSSRK